MVGNEVLRIVDSNICIKMEVANIIGSIFFAVLEILSFSITQIYINLSISTSFGNDKLFSMKLYNNTE